VGRLGSGSRVGALGIFGGIFGRGLSLGELSPKLSPRISMRWGLKVEQRERFTLLNENGSDHNFYPKTECFGALLGTA